MDWKTETQKGEKLKRKDYLKRFCKRLYSNNTVLWLKRFPIKESTEKQEWDGEIKLATFETIQDISCFEDADYYIPIYKKMMLNGDKVILGYLHGRCVFRTCLQCSGAVFWDGCFVKELSENEAYIHYVFCDPNYRRSGFFSHCLKWIIDHYSEKTLYAQVAEDNIPSLNGFYNKGFQAYKKLTSHNLLFKRRLEIKNV